MKLESVIPAKVDLSCTCHKNIPSFVILAHASIQLNILKHSCMDFCLLGNDKKLIFHFIYF